MLRIAIVEDEEQSRRALCEYVERYGAEEGLELKLSLFSDAESLIDGYSADYDIILLDIELPGINGMEAAEKIRESDERTVLMFVTNMAGFAIRGYSVGALDFVMKPVSYFSFRLRFHRAADRALQRRGEELLLETSEGMERVALESIYYIEVQNRMLHFHTDRGEIVLRGTMQSISERLSGCHFAKCNHWYLVNLRHVQSVRKDSALVAERELEISRRSRSSFLNALTEYMGGSR